jgi:cytosine/adenosine deaminase-related metal-dependent hydrolase
MAGLDGSRREHFSPVVLGRPGTTIARPADERGFWDKMRTLLDSCDGLGLSSISDGDAAWNAEVARFARRHGKLVEVHCSEVEREPIAQVLEAGAQLVVHMVRGEASDFALLAERQVPVAVCTRSNEFFGLRAPVPLMVKAGVDIRLGTDNAFLGAPDMFEEARAFARVHKAAAHLSPIQILRFMLRKKGINEGAPIAPREGSQPDFLIVDLQTERPDRDLIAKARSEDVVAIVGLQGGV